MPLESLTSGFYNAAGALLEHGIRLWVCLAGRLVEKSDLPWLSSPIGTRARIGNEFYGQLADREGLQISKSTDAGLLPSFELLKGPQFDPALVRPEIRDFYEHTARFHLEAWSETGLVSRIFLWVLVTFVSRRMDQLNFPLSPLELSAGMRSEVIELDDSQTGKRVYTGWLRTMVATGKIIYAGLYSTTTPAEYAGPVSYTHLDVYKRQISPYPQESQLFPSPAHIGEVINCFNEIMEGDAATIYGLLSEFCHPDMAVLKQHFQWDGTQSVTFDAPEGNTALPVGASATLAALEAVSELLELSNETEIRTKVAQLLRKLVSSGRI